MPSSRFAVLSVSLTPQASSRLQLSNRVAEIWALLSLQGEVYLDLPDSPWTVPQKGYAHDWDTHGGDVWLHQHVAEKYTPCWQNPLANGDMDGAMCDIGTSRWFNCERRRL